MKDFENEEHTAPKRDERGGGKRSQGTADFENDEHSARKGTTESEVEEGQTAKSTETQDISTQETSKVPGRYRICRFLGVNLNTRRLTS